MQRVTQSQYLKPWNPFKMVEAQKFFQLIQNGQFWMFKWSKLSTSVIPIETLFSARNYARMTRSPSSAFNKSDTEHKIIPSYHLWVVKWSVKLDVNRRYQCTRRITSPYFLRTNCCRRSKIVWRYKKGTLEYGSHSFWLKVIRVQNYRDYLTSVQ